MAVQGCNSNSQTASTKAVDINQAFGNSAIRRGINLGNALDSPTPWEWGITIQPEYFNAIKDAGFDTVRIPVRFSAHADPNPPYLIDEDFLQLVDSVVLQGLSTGLNVILDMHHYEEIMLDPTGHYERFLALWNQLAIHYKNHSQNLYFEILNEPNQSMDAASWNALLLDCIRTIRENDPNRTILVGGIDYNSIDSLEELDLPADENLMAIIHFYLPFKFTHQGAPWVSRADRWIGTTWEGTPAEKAVITKELDRAAAWSVNHRIPLVITEFGSISEADAASRQKWTSFFAQEAQKRNLGWVYWELCSDFGVYDCDQNSWDEEMLSTLIGN